MRVAILAGGELADVIRRGPMPAGQESQHLGLSGAEACLRCPGGAHKSPITLSLIERRLGVAAPSRNWNTVGKLASLAA